MRILRSIIPFIMAAAAPIERQTMLAIEAFNPTHTLDAPKIHRASGPTRSKRTVAQDRRASAKRRAKRRAKRLGQA